mmetsp:Transcript_62658/g.125543  ORF Transcript_62658/g.125543 Transcript_62658/m.125543 type:complete len:211 (-) Transcript_62658:174-806(-)
MSLDDDEEEEWWATQVPCSALQVASESYPSLLPAPTRSADDANSVASLASKLLASPPTLTLAHSSCARENTASRQAAKWPKGSGCSRMAVATSANSDRVSVGSSGLLLASPISPPPPSCLKLSRWPQASTDSIASVASDASSCPSPSLSVTINAACSCSMLMRSGLGCARARGTVKSFVRAPSPQRSERQSLATTSKPSTVLDAFKRCCC